MKPGPKDWLPGPKPHRLSDDERARLEAIWKRADDGCRVPVEDTLWVCKLAMALDRPAFDEFTFPPGLALINYPVMNAFMMRWKNKELIRNRWESLGGLKAGRHVILDYTGSMEVCEAILVVRPYIRLEFPEGEHAIAILRRATVSLHLEETHKEKTTTKTTVIIPDDPLDDHLICPDGKVFRKLPYVFSLEGKDLFLAGHPTLKVVDRFDARSLEEAVTPSPELGFMIAHDARLVMALDVPDVLDENVALIAGLVASRYSTK